jgi:hypothetical protein
MNQAQLAGAYKSGLINKHRWLLIETEYNKKPNLCNHCRTPLVFLKRKGKFCGHRCSALHHRNRLGTGKTKPTCACGRILRTKTNRIFCYICWRIEYIRLWRLGVVSGEMGGKLSRVIRDWLIETRGEKCELCDWSEVNTKTGNVPITIDHIDGNSMNHKEENLRILCPNCHSLTHTYCSLNLGNGRAERREHYKRTPRHINSKNVVGSNPTEGATSL